ncbi:hypothetical protein [Pedobacter sp. UBA4863]|uniref:hypothetical protein n=1 Tax=Pedobacter sp. UBA4863 TaxID=1947060 RepID=UPI0025F3F257|nr:hypothetical protein [Pedobacter sp. UBA4863]
MSKKAFDKKTILVAVPDFVGFPEGFKLGLTALGFNVYVLRNYEYIKIGFWNTLVHTFKKVLLGVKSFKKQKRRELDYAKQLQNLAQLNINHFDYALFIRPDLFAIELIEAVKNKTDKVVAYQWDGLDVYPEIYTRIDLFDRFFVFDINDLSKRPNLLPLTNFYFDHISPSVIDNDVYFVGYYKEDRIEDLLRLARKLRDLTLRTSINICVNATKQITKLKKEPVNILTKQVSLMENIDNVCRSRVVLDVANVVHCGLSVRPFEALGYKKKLITNNVLVRKYDFYKPSNIYIIENGNLDGLEEFLALPYEEVPNEIIEKYSFTNWIKYVLAIEPHQAINFPE